MMMFDKVRQPIKILGSESNLGEKVAFERSAPGASFATGISGAYVLRKINRNTPESAETRLQHPNG